MEEVAATLEATLASFGSRHRDLETIFEEHFDLVAHRLGHHNHLTEERRLLMGAYFTNEYSVEGAALFNPSIVLHPDQSQMGFGEARIVGPQLGADDAEARLERFPVDPDALDRARRGPLPGRDLGTLESRPGDGSVFEIDLPVATS